MGRIKFLPRGASKYTPPPLLHWKMPFGQKWGRGGAYKIFPWTCFEVLETSFQAKICTNSPKLCTNSLKICTNFPQRFQKHIVTRFLNNFRIYGTPPSPGVAMILTYLQQKTSPKICHKLKQFRSYDHSLACSPSLAIGAHILGFLGLSGSPPFGRVSAWPYFSVPFTPKFLQINSPPVFFL